MFKKKGRKKIGLVLGSGGFRGMAHIGILRVLIKNDIPIDFISGCSAGAIFAAHYAVFKDIEKAEADIFKQQSKKYSYLRDISLKNGLLSGKTIENDFLKMYKGAGFENTQIPLVVVATDLISGEPFFFTEGDIYKAVRASVSLPFTFRPFKYKNRVFVDGAVSCPLPDKILKDMGADIVISVNLYNRRKSEISKFSLSDVVSRSTEIGLVNSSEREANFSDVIINPDTSKYVDMSRIQTYFDKKISLEIIKVAEKETEKMIPEIKKICSC